MIGFDAWQPKVICHFYIRKSNRLNGVVFLLCLQRYGTGNKKG
jgi:hypothetical protein